MKRACCICGDTIDRSDAGAVQIVLTSLWNRRNPVSQEMQAHSACFAGIVTEEIMFDAQVWSDKD